MNSENSFKNQVACLTGGGDGLGLALAQDLARRGATVCLFDIDESALRSAKEMIGSNCRTFIVNIAAPDQVNSAASGILSEFGRIDILVNSAGITGKTNLKSHLVEVEDFDRVLSVNLKGTFLTCQAVLPAMLAAGYGRILNIASIAGKEGNAGMVAYSASKAAVIGLTKSMGKEYAGTGITINALAPAVIQTAMVAKMPEEQVQYMTDKIPMKRCGTLDEFGAISRFILSAQNSFSTGFTFDLSGGRAVY